MVAFVHLIAFSILLGGAQVGAQEPVFPTGLSQSDIDTCYEDPAFGSIGGAMIGDCLLDKAAQIDDQIDLMVERLAGAHCRPGEESAFRAAQSLWRDYRDQWCQTIADAPGNTPAYINAMACRLSLTRERLQQIEFFAQVAQPRCAP